MKAENKSIIPESIRDNESFLHDLQRILNVPTEFLVALSDKIKPNLYEPLSEEDLNELSSRLRWKIEDLRRIAATIVFLRQRLIDTGQTPMDAVTESISILEHEDLSEDQKNEIASALSYSEDERKEVLAIGAFSGGSTFLNTNIRPSLLPVTSSGTELVGGYYWTISYLNAEAEQRSITIGLTPGELEQIDTAFGRARKQLKALNKIIDSTRTEQE